MNFLGMGPMELFVILVLALIFIGPAKLPELMGQIGRTMRDFQKATSELSNEFNSALQAEIEETKAAVEGREVAAKPQNQTVVPQGTTVITPAPQLTTPAPVAVAADPVPHVNGTSSTPTAASETTPSYTWPEESPTGLPQPQPPTATDGTQGTGPAPASDDRRPPSAA